MSNVGVKVKARVEPVVLPKIFARAQVAGELVNAFGGSAAEIEVAQTGVARQLFEEVIVYGLDSSGCERDRAAVSFTGDASGDVLLDLDGGNRSAIEAFDGGFGRAVAHAAARMRRRGFSPDIRYAFTKAIYADPPRLAALRAELGLKPAAAPNSRPGYQPKEVLRLRPGKDSGLLFSFFQEFGES